MTHVQYHFLLAQILAIFADRPKESVSDWCERELQFDEPDNRGPFTLSGREYCREPLDNWADQSISDQVEVFASQTCKTGMSMGGAAWTSEHDPARIFWVMPTRDKVRSFSNTRWIPMVRKSPCLAARIPHGSRRHDFSKLQQILGGSIFDFVWSNSPAALSSDPARIVILDEVDKFPQNPGSEADAVNLAEQRTKNFSSPKRFKKSTPTLSSGLTWQEFLKSDQRRRFMPCPSCKKFVVLAWSKDFTVFKLTGAEAFVRWDKEAKRKEGGWDLDRVERSARHECPHCGGHIRDGHKTAMDRLGQWRPTAPASKNWRGYHLPGMYSCASENNTGKMALRFLTGKLSLMGLQGFINGDLAEPWENQEARSERIELVTPADAKPLAESMKLLTADWQLISPHVWFVVREWAGHSRLIDFGPLDSIEELRAKQIEWDITDNHVGIDSGHAAEEIYEACLQFGKMIRRPHGIPFWAGWTPMKGFDRRDQWMVPVLDRTGAPQKTAGGKTVLQPQPFNLGAAALPHRRFRLPLLEFSSHHLKDILDRLRTGKTAWRWEVLDEAPKSSASSMEEYFKHLDADIKKPMYHARNHRVTFEWVKRARTWPDHLRDCELEQEAMALFHRVLPLGQELREEAK